MKNEWDKIAEDWDNLIANRNYFQKYIIYPSIVKILGNPTNKRIIDVGCGNGDLIYYLHELYNANYVGIDKSKKMIEICTKKLKIDSNIEFFTWDIEKVLNKDYIFDIAIYNNSLQDMKNFKTCIENVKKNLILNGLLIICVKHPCFHPVNLEQGWKIHTKDNRIFYTNHGLTQLLKEKECFSGEYFIIDDYLNNFEHIRFWNNNKTISFSRTLEVYFNTLTDLGFSIEKIYEPKPEEEGRKDNPSLYSLLERIPNFIFFKARRIE